MDWAEVLPVIVTTIMTGFVTLGLAYIAAKFRQVESSIAKTHEVAVSIDHAVNGKDPRQTTISQDVSTVMAKQERDQPTDATGAVPVAVLPLVMEMREAIRHIQTRLERQETP